MKFPNKQSVLILWALTEFEVLIGHNWVSALASLLRRLLIWFYNQRLQTSNRSFSLWAWFWNNHWTFFLALWGEFFKRDAWDFLDSTRSFSHNSQKCLTDGFLKSSLFTELLQDYPKRWEWSQQFGLLVSLNQGIRISIFFIRPSPTIALPSHSVSKSVTPHCETDMTLTYCDMDLSKLIQGFL